MKTAVIVAGMSRHTKFAVSSWNNLPEADWYLSTWNEISYNHEPDVVWPLGDEIDHIREKFKEILISNYSEYIDICETNNINKKFARPFYLLNNVYNIIKDKNYERIIYFRPDLRLFYLENYSHSDFNVTDSNCKMLGIEEPANWYIPVQQYSDDYFFVFTWKIFKLFLEYGFNIKPDISNVHPLIFDFFKKNDIDVELLHSMRSVLLRHTINTRNYEKSFEKLSELYQIAEGNTDLRNLL